MDGVEGNNGGPMETGQEGPALPLLVEPAEGQEIILNGQRLLVEPATAEEQAIIRQMRARSGWLSEGKKWVGVVLLSLAVGSGIGGGPPKQVTRTGGQGGTIRRGVRTAPGSRRKEESQETNDDGRILLGENAPKQNFAL